MCNIWDSIINVSFGCQNPLEALMKLYGYPPIHASSDDNAVDLIFIHYICLLLVSFRSVFICSVLYFVALYKSHVPHPITYDMSVYFFVICFLNNHYYNLNTYLYNLCAPNQISLLTSSWREIITFNWLICLQIWIHQSIFFFFFFIFSNACKCVVHKQYVALFCPCLPEIGCLVSKFYSLPVGVVELYHVLIHTHEEACGLPPVDCHYSKGNHIIGRD